MTQDVEIILVTPTDRTRSSEAGTVSGQRSPLEDAAVRRHSGLVLQTVRDAWIYCKASKKMVAGNQLLPWLSASTAVISALTGVAVFASLQDNPATWARMVVGGVALLTGAITALQTWTSSRIRALNNQAHGFHELHRSMMADLEAGKDLADPEYAARREAELQGLVAGISEPSQRLWHDSERRVDKEWKQLFSGVKLGSGK